MSYTIVFQKRTAKPWKVKQDGKVVGSFVTKKEAESDVRERTEEAAKKRKKKRRPIEDMA